MGGDELLAAVTRHFREGAHRYGLSADEVRVTPVLNWGGFANAHFEVNGTYHLKLAGDRATIDGLRRWRALAPALEASYRAPKVVDWIDLRGHSGLLLARSPGRPPDLASEPALARELLGLLERLHRDEGLERSLRELGLGGDARGSVVEHYMGNIDADLAESGDRFPVAADLLAWMRREAGVVRGVLEGSRAFRGVRAVPIHDDLWKDNILAEPSGAWTVIDWDGIRLGDPVLDYAVLLWPLLREGAEASRWLPRDPGLDERLRLCLRAALLEEVIDPLADWVEATRMPEHLDVVRPEKLRVHGAALEDYRHRYAR